MGLLVSSHINRLGCGNCLRGDRLATTQAKMQEYLDKVVLSVGG
ncbi:hypothetical protein PMG71_00485 [Roseofilum sp. BLCC_M154]|uniref:Uncharacterized protein n=1 Tax=Roseofilum acuticapitatum BLCC-M154 TaxID=3022444 RepID=A0ABT7ALX7_9CYAN|nr:hypothetical protein [Roseofilum acuticapitatum]MDJ1167897.1 hypothetical protein [Roseofilum acuticapitatum BLCC-M154]